MALQIAVRGQIVSRFVLVVTRSSSRCRPGRGRPLRGTGRASRRHPFAAAGGPYCAELRVRSIERRRRFPERVGGGSFPAVKKQICENILSTCCAHKGRGIGCHYAGQKRKGWGGSPASVKDIVLLFLLFFSSSLRVCA